jgi:hypothetical protein
MIAVVGVHVVDKVHDTLSLIVHIDYHGVNYTAIVSHEIILDFV